MSYPEASRNLGRMMERVCREREPLTITRRGAASVVMVSLKEYESLQETAYLLRSPANAMRLIESIACLERGEGDVRQA